MVYISNFHSLGISPINYPKQLELAKTHLYNTLILYYGVLATVQSQGSNKMNKKIKSLKDNKMYSNDLSHILIFKQKLKHFNLLTALTLPLIISCNLVWSFLL